MSFHLLVNGNYQPQNVKFKADISEKIKDNMNKQRHVTFRQGNNISGNLSQTSKQKYNFTYGNAYQPNVPYQNTSMINSLNSDLIRQNNINQFQVNGVLGNSKQNINKSGQKNKNSGLRKQRLKIFPQKYQKIEQKTYHHKNQQNKQVQELKNEILRLKSQLKNISLNISKNTSRGDVNQSVYKNQAQRTKRINQLNSFNQRLYSKLAQKLQQISLQQYSHYLEHTKQNKILLNSVLYSSPKKQMSHYYHTFDNHQNSNDKFMDNQEFQKKYQQNFKNTISHSSKKQLAINVHNNFYNQEVQSPFLLKENKFQQTYQTKPQIYKFVQKKEPYTFHKQKHHYHHRQKSRQKQPYQKQYSSLSNKLVLLQTPNHHIHHIENNLQNIKENKIHQQKKIHQNQQTLKKLYAKQKPQHSTNLIHEFNQRLENKILRKRIASQHVNFHKSRLH